MSGEQENKSTRKIGMEKTPNSGATPFRKGDGLDNYAVMECKTKMKPSKSMRVQKSWLDKIEKECFKMGREIAIVNINFGDGEDYYILNETDFAEMYEIWKMYREGRLVESSK